MKKLLLIILLFIVACSKQTGKHDIKTNETVVLEKNQNEDQKTTTYKEKEERIIKNEVAIDSEKETVETHKESRSEVVIKDKVEVKTNINNSIKKEEPKVEDKQESSPPVALPKEDVAPIPKPMPENPPEVKPDPPKEEVFVEKIYIGEVGNSGMEFTSWDEAGNFAEEQVHDKNSKYYHYSWVRTTIIYYTYDSKGNVVANSKRESYTIDFWE